MAKDSSAVKGADKQARKKSLRRLEKAQLSHQKAERRTGKLRMKLEKAEAKLAQIAQNLIAVQSLLDNSRSAPTGNATSKSDPKTKAVSNNGDAAAKPIAKANGAAKSANPAKGKTQAAKGALKVPVKPMQSGTAPSTSS
jgi:hypothetical protein